MCDDGYNSGPVYKLTIEGYRREIERALAATRITDAVKYFDQWLRNEIKYGDANQTEETVLTLQSVRDKFYYVLREEDVLEDWECWDDG